MLCMDVLEIVGVKRLFMGRTMLCVAGARKRFSCKTTKDTEIRGIDSVKKRKNSIKDQSSSENENEH